MAYEETHLFPRLAERGLAPEVQVAEKHHATLREVLAHHAAPAYVVASGRLVASSGSSTTFEGAWAQPR